MYLNCIYLSFSKLNHQRHVFQDKKKKDFNFPANTSLKIDKVKASDTKILLS